VHDDDELQDALQTQQTLAFDLDTYRLLARHLDVPAWVHKTQLQLIKLPAVA
jgi:hypothetical protein